MTLTTCQLPPDPRDPMPYIVLVCVVVSIILLNVFL
jgi:hypothetical protein